MKICYRPKNFHAATLSTIRLANQIIDEYSQQGFRLTLRQLYYQFVSRDLIPNKTSAYDKLGGTINSARLAGLIDWDAIEDRTRNVRKNNHWPNPGSIIRSARYSFRLDHWENQLTRLEVWIEKEALIGVISDICIELDVPYFACKGYVSQSEMWKAAQRMKNYEDNYGQETVIIHLGDHDPSGIDMTRDIQDRFSLFEAKTEVIRIALNMEQVEEFNPPPNPAKITDSRFSGYRAIYGDSSWELDALSPTTLETLIQQYIDKFRYEEIYQRTLAKEKEYISILEKIENNWETL